MTFFKNLFTQFLGGEKKTTAVVEYSAGSCIGSRRENQDNFRAGRRVPFIKAGRKTVAQGVLKLDDMDLFCVCDGVGGGYRGDLAAKYALKAIKRYLDATHTDVQSLRTILLEAAEAAQREVCAFYETAHNVGGCTLAMIALRGARYAFLNIGDSPGFLIPFGGTIQELSQRHNLAWEKLRMNLPVGQTDGNRLLHYLGMNDMAAEEIAYITEGTLTEGDRILLCTDGVTNTFPLPSLEKAVCSNMTAGQITGAAAQNEGSDNCTAICLMIREIITLQTAQDASERGDKDDADGKTETGAGDYPM